MIKFHTTTQLFAKEGWSYIGVFFVIFGIALYLQFFQWFFLALLLVAMYVFRNPERIPAEDDDMAILSPCDGTVESISKVTIPTSNLEVVRVVLKKSLSDVSFLRAPTALYIQKTEKIHGLFLPINSSVAQGLIERVILTCESKFSTVRMIVNVGMFGRKVDLFKSVGPLKSAQRFGLLVDGSVKLYLPIDTRIKATIGDSVKAGESVLGYFGYEKQDDNE
ncbi:MAG: phosphatidylserine decarboxylase [Sulfurospirillaceae bacterium]|nr:phosphatidylserine decarboxylase [Sulfurospirillaceae bacterium]MDD3462306.1 phosphatidylserine decarboxylase [Sulfurospirillaceae bacterium]